MISNHVNIEYFLIFNHKQTFSPALFEVEQIFPASNMQKK